MKGPALTVSRRNQGALRVIPILGLSLGLALVLVVIVNTAMPVSAETSGPLNAGTGANVNGPGTIAWTNPGFIVDDDTNYATAVLTTSAISEYLQGTNYGFSIPLDATITGITVSIMRQSSSNAGGNSVDDSNLRLLKAGALVGTNHAVTTDWPITMTLATYGGTADLWGTTWTPAEINANNFGMSLSVLNESGFTNRTAYVDYMQITVTYVFGTTTAVATSGSPTTYGDSVTFTATVTRSGGTNTPSGTVDFQDGGISIGIGTLSDIGGGAAQATFVTSSLAADNHDITAVYNGDSNFSGSTSSPITQLVNQRNITVTADAQSKVYGDSDPALTYQITSGSLVSGDSFIGALSRVAGEALGSYAIQQGTLALNSNYNLTYVGANLSITIRPITVTADAQSKVYGDADPALTYQITSGSLAFSDTFSGALSRAAGEAVGNYAIQQGTLALSSNYTLTYVGANLTITPSAITVTADAKSKVYSTADPALTFAYAPALLGGDSFSGALSRAAGEAVGNYAIQQGTLALSSNYTLTYVGANLTITPLAITVTADPGQGKVYGDADPVLTYTYSPALLGGDSFSGALSRTAGENVGNHAITQGTLMAGSNYTIIFVPDNFVITPRTLIITANNQSKTYGTTLSFAGTEFTVIGLEGSAMVTSVTLTSFGADAAAAAGTYDIVPSAAVGTGLDAYNISYVNGSLTVNRASIAWSVSSSPKPSTRGESVTFTATSSDARVTGTVTFKDGGAVLSRRPLSNGVATYSTSVLSAGNHYITVSYEGSANFADSTPLAYVHTVKAPVGIDWWLIGRIIAAAGVVGLFLCLLFWRRKRKHS